MNCKIGDLAITVTSELPENLGKLVKIVGVKGLSWWSDFPEPVFLWRVQALGPQTPLVYQFGSGPKQAVLEGHVPDHFLRPIRPPKASQALSRSVQKERNTTTQTGSQASREVSTCL